MHLNASFSQNRTAQEWHLVGRGGIGKTQVALSLAYCVREKHSEFSVFWVPALSVKNFEQAYREIAGLLRIRSVSNEEEDIKEAVRRHLSGTSAGQWLLIVDHADDMDILEGLETAAGLLEYLPESDLGLTIFTTRSHEVAQSLVGSDVVEVERMEPEEAMSLFDRSVVRKELLNDEANTTELLDELDRLPLAITQAAAYLNVNRSVGVEVSAASSKHGAGCGIHSQHGNPGWNAVQAGGECGGNDMDGVVQADREAEWVAADLLYIMSCIECKAIPHSILPEVRPAARMTSAIGMLCSYSFDRSSRMRISTTCIGWYIWQSEYGMVEKVSEQRR
jgi:hypothetical protein